jgi:hypothetical protein
MLPPNGLVVEHLPRGSRRLWHLATLLVLPSLRLVHTCDTIWLIAIAFLNGGG